MNSSPCHFVPSTPCLHGRNACFSSPFATVPDVRLSQSPGFGNPVAFAAHIAVVPRTPRLPEPADVQLTRQQGRHSAQLTVCRQPNAEDADQLVPSTGVDTTEQIVPTTPHIQASPGTCKTLLDHWTAKKTCSTVSISNKTRAGTSSRKIVLKKRLSPKGRKACGIKPFYLFSSDEIFG